MFRTSRAIHCNAAWERDRNAISTGVNWRFTTADARIKLKRLYPSHQPHQPLPPTVCGEPLKDTGYRVLALFVSQALGHT